MTYDEAYETYHAMAIDAAASGLPAATEKQIRYLSKLASDAMQAGKLKALPMISSQPFMRSTASRLISAMKNTF